VKAILIPVKEFCEAKKRLAAHFSAEERGELARALCHDFFSMVATVRNVDRIVVISKEPEALVQAQQRGWQTIIEAQQTSESTSVDFASGQCAGEGVEALLRIPIDLPLAEPEDIEGLFDPLNNALARDSVTTPATVIVPSADGTGTNALLRTPPELFPSRFGPNSFALHLAEAESRGIRALVIRNARLAQDIDELEDLERLEPLLRPGSETARWMKEHGSRLLELRASASRSARA
jgi:2-phospho-L-lactate guanylyltransferase